MAQYLYQLKDNMLTYIAAVSENISKTTTVHWVQTEEQYVTPAAALDRRSTEDRNCFFMWSSVLKRESAN